MPGPRRLGAEGPYQFNPRRFRSLMGLAGITSILELAQTCGVARQLATYYAAGALPPLAHRRRLAAALGVQPEEIWRPVADEHPAEPQAAAGGRR